MRRLASLNVPILVAAGSLLLSLMAGYGQVSGFFGQVSLATAAASVVIAILVFVTFPNLLRRHATSARMGRFTATRVAAMLAALVVVFGTGPFIAKLSSAAYERSAGTRFLDRGLSDPARVHLAQSVRLFDELGLATKAVDSRIMLVNAEAGLGESGHVNDLLGQIEKAGVLDQQLQVRFDIVRGGLAFNDGEYEQAERFFQAAHQSVTPGDRDEAILLQNEGALWAQRGAEHRQLAATNYHAAGRVYAAINDEIGLARIAMLEANLYEDDPNEAIPRLEKALVLAKKAKHEELTGTIELNLGRVLNREGRLDEADTHFARALESYQHASDLDGAAEVAISRSMLESRRGHTDLALQHLRQSAAYWRNVGRTNGPIANSRTRAKLSVQLADLYDGLGLSDSAEAHYREALALYAMAPDAAAEAAARVNYAGLLLRLDRGFDARQELRRAREILGGARRRDLEDIGVLHNNLGIAYQNMRDFANARVHFDTAAALFDSLGNRLLATEARENIAVLDLHEGSSKLAAQRIERAVAVYDSLQHYDRQVKGIYNLFVIYTTSKDARASLQLPRILRILNEHQVDQETESQILFGLRPGDFRKADLVSFRERIQGLYEFYDKEKEPAGTSQSLLQLARIEQSFGNQARAHDYAERAAQHADRIALPQRIGVYMDLGFLLAERDPAGGVDQLWRAFDLLEGGDAEQRLDLLTEIGTLLPALPGSAREAQRGKLETIARTDQGSVGKKATRLLRTL